MLYDTREAGNAAGRYVFYNELVEALRGSSAMYSVYKEGAFHSSAAQPVLYRNQIIGGVYVYEYDTQQAALLENLRNTLLSISLGIAGLVVTLSMIFSRQLTWRLASLQGAIRTFSSVSSSRPATAALRAETLLRRVVRLARNTRSWLTSRG